MKPARIALASVILALAAVELSASGPVGIYGIIEKVVFEPNEGAADRLQVWGAFAYTDGYGGGAAVSQAKRGYLYFQIPDRGNSIVLREWQDLKSVAGTGQVVGFGKWVYIGRFGDISPDELGKYGIYLPAGGQRQYVRVRPELEKLSNPATYSTNAGVVKIGEGSHAALIKLLRDALKR